MDAGLDYKNTFLENRQTEDLLNNGQDYLLYPLGTKLYYPYYKGNRVKIFEIYGIEICGAGVDYLITQIKPKRLLTERIPERLIGKGKFFELEPIPTKANNSMGFQYKEEGDKE